MRLYPLAARLHIYTVFSCYSIFFPWRKWFVYYFLIILDAKRISLKRLDMENDYENDLYAKSFFVSHSWSKKWDAAWEIKNIESFIAHYLQYKYMACRKLQMI